MNNEKDSLGAFGEEKKIRYLCKVRLRDEPQKEAKIISLEAANYDDAVAQLFAKNYLIVNVEQETPDEREGFSGPAVGSHAAELALGVKLRKKTLFKTLSTRDLITFAIQLATLLHAGIAIIRGLRIIQKGTQDKNFNAILGDLVNQLSQGFSFSQAINTYPNIFPNVWVNLVEVGELSGTLPSVLEEVARYQESSERIKGKVISAFFYPAILGFLAMGAVVFLLLTIVPKFEVIFKSMRMELPGITKGVLLISNIIQHYSLFVLAGVGLFFFGMRLIKKTKKGKYVMDNLLLKAPVVGSLLLEVACVRFTRALATLLKSGVPLLQSLKIAAKLFENAVLLKVINDAHDAVAEGHAMSRQLETARIFPMFMTQLLSVGEETGEMVRFLQMIGNYYEEKVDVFLGRMSSILEPIMLVLVGAVIGVIIVAVFLPLLDISTNVGA